jgi:hypothetical protein
MCRRQAHAAPRWAAHAPPLTLPVGVCTAGSVIGDSVIVRKAIRNFW